MIVWTDGDSLRHYFGLLTTDLNYWLLLLTFGIFFALVGALRGAEWV